MLVGCNIGFVLSMVMLMVFWVIGNIILFVFEFGYKIGFWGMFSYVLVGFGLILFVFLVLWIK